MPTNTAIALDRTYMEDAGLPARRRSAFLVLRHLLRLDDDVSTRHRRELLSTALWKWTEAEGVAPHSKYHVRLRSAGAIDVSRPASVNHEHVWPRKWIIDRLLSRTSWPDEDLWALLEQHAVACTVTVEEHARLSVARGLGWARYIEAGVTVHDMLLDAPFVIPGLGAAPRVEPEVVGVTETPADVVEEPTTSGETVPPEEAIEQKAGPRAALFRSLLARLGTEDVVVAVGRTRDPDRPIGHYLRIHDTALEEPSPAVAYLHWNGKLSVRLLHRELPAYLREEGGATSTTHGTYGVEYRVEDRADLDVVEALIELALEKVRSL